MRLIRKRELEEITDIVCLFGVFKSQRGSIIVKIFHRIHLNKAFMLLLISAWCGYLTKQIVREIMFRVLFCAID